MTQIKYDVDRNFRPHQLTPEQIETVKALESGFVLLAQSIVEQCPANGETMLALRALEVAKMQAVESISRGPQ